ncbi:MAG TPA: YjbF family lipoprotein [Rhizomicrobium sp.]|nr:YjbF family lipoprotein [Rhizomicrobium sp.]
MGWSELYGAAGQMFSGGEGGVTLKEAAAVPYASMGVRVGDGPEAMVVLASDSDGQRLWTSAAHIALLTHGGRIVRSSGFAHNLSAVTGTDPLPAFADPDAGPREVTRQVDFWDMNLFAVTLSCRIESKGDDPVTILGATINTHRVEESCTATRPDWSFTDTFWMDKSGLVWKSVQHINPALDPVETEILRPPSG